MAAAHATRLRVGARVGGGFTDAGGCLAAAGVVAALIEEQVWPDMPCLVGVDHCLAGGAITALSGSLGPENLSVVVLDAHTDAIPTPVSAGAIHYDAETNPRSVYRLDDPLLHGRNDSYNASSFLHHLVEGGIVAPRNLFLLGVTDLPPSRALKLTDPRITAYTDAYMGLKRRGVTVLTRDDIVASAARVDRELDRIDTPYVYVSLDLDVGARKSLDGVRFREREGLGRARLEAVIASVGRLVDRVELVGLDVSEINPRKAGPGTMAPEDATYDVACLFLETLLGEGSAASALSPGKGDPCLRTCSSNR